MMLTDLKAKLKIVESDITNIKRKIKRFQREGKYDQIQWRRNILTKLKRKATLIYRVLEAHKNLEKEWTQLTKH